ncbi:MAG TPA: hypothetical protein ENI87_06850, partial [bacterium]|nr:hypothetical protein [bacterium]
MRTLRALPPTVALLATLLASSLTAQTSASAAIELTVQVQQNPPAVTFQWPASTTALQYAVRRRAFGASTWGNFQWVPGGGSATSWTDATVQIGERYEYWFTRTGSPIAQGFATVGIEALPIEDRGFLILIVDNTHTTALA